MTGLLSVIRGGVLKGESLRLAEARLAFLFSPLLQTLSRLRRFENKKACRS